MACSPDLGLEVELPVIDLSGFAQTTDDAHYHQVITKAKQACEEWGFFRVVNHGIPETLLQDVASALHELCAMPAEVKQRWATDDPKESYVTRRNRETFTIPHSEPVLEKSRKIWPQDGNPLFCKTVETFRDLLTDLGRTLTKIILATLDLDVEHFYESDFKNCVYRMAIAHYTSEGKSTGEEALVPHTDHELFAILLNIGNEGGLQIRSKEGTWLDVKPLSHSFIINIANTFKAWSNGKLRSVEHRVVYKGWTDRLSFVCGVRFPGEKEVWAPPELVNEQHPRRYRPFIFSHFWRDCFDNPNIRDKASFIDRYAGL